MAPADLAFSPERLLQTLRGLPVPGSYRVAISGGLDSVVLLHALHAISGKLAAPLTAVHVNHGLHGDALEWEDFCEALCASLDIPLLSLQLELQPLRGMSLEAMAREARYSIIAEQMAEGEMLLTAHHGDDQVETVLLQLLRGAGVTGLAAMPVLRDWQSGWLARPLLGFSRAELQAWAEKHGLRWREDPSNLETDIRRNYLRHEIVPLLREQWPGLLATVGRSARHCGEAAAILQQVAEEDLMLVLDLAHPWQLPLPGLGVLPAERLKNLLRYWIGSRDLPVPGEQIITRILQEVVPAREDALPQVDWEGGQLRRYRGRLYLMPSLPGVPEAGLALTWNGREDLILPAGLGKLHAREITDWLTAGVSVVFREEGMRCRLAGREGERSFKRLCQDLHIPPWLRSRMPLLVQDGRLLALGDYGLCEPLSGENPLVWERPEWLS
ncbi:tRNA lysidine(34) synthetase TilS [Thiolapillus brandeum]|uniref:tRNA(Ile)-lysidine synthase n=1 Tax=Thiolapillus brandeum TaxID=1076588 RepID=A0A7U6JIC7_9GAMM|nr:tRNA lysidine(34) synthetase TilS [Thiolapillus brandeum]BAO44095.1 tRNA(Ile)-lysidine synthase [Thiolapillus brandeum]